MHIVLLITILFFLVRIVTIFISIKNEQRIKKLGAIEYGKLNSLLLTLVHITVYGGSFYEAYIKNVEFNLYSKIGFCIMVFSYLMLFYVIYALREVWTVKIFIVPNHKIVKSFLFRTIRHPNYFLNIIPEIIGITLLCNAWKTMIFVLPIYIVVLIIRIYQEEKAMKGML
ncbi:isoprenylcysteine carboxylmethyltransferase family protein [Chryseobacterium sp.]|uniref:isoprenylcysteine carboxyl methyltransferase family protein n=1 Tax=Chryseobacterium sp. TaxID=1871047 RepID=UPI0031DE4214